MHNYIRGNAVQILPDGSRNPSTDLLAFRAGKLAGDCPTANCSIVPGWSMDPSYALVGGDPLLLVPDVVLSFPQAGTTETTADHRW
jgi:hypothetical protein